MVSTPTTLADKKYDKNVVKPRILVLNMNEIKLCTTFVTIIIMDGFTEIELWGNFFNLGACGLKGFLSTQFAGKLYPIIISKYGT